MTHGIKGVHLPLVQTHFCVSSCLSGVLVLIRVHVVK